MAAVLAAGPGAVLSHRSAAAVHGILPVRSGRIHVTVPRGLRSRSAVVFHHVKLPPDELDRIDGIPVTALSRTVLDLAAAGDRNEVERAFHEAEVRRLTDRLSLEDLIARYPRRKGVPMVRAVLEDRRIGVTTTRGELEERFLPFLASRGFPRPEINAIVVVGERQFEVDCVWRAAKVIVELDDRASHQTVRAFERDRVRDRALQAAGWTVVRVTSRQLDTDADGLAADLWALLPSRRNRTSPPYG